MKNLVPCFVLVQLCAAIVSCQSTSVQAAPPANPNATAKTVDVLNYITNLKTATKNKVLSGQHISHSGNDVTWAYPTYIENLKSTTGKYVSILGMGMTTRDLSIPVTTATNFWNAGGLVQIDAHFDNPWIAEGSWVAKQSAPKLNLLELIPGESAFNATAYSKWKSQIDNTAAALKQLQNAGVTVLWRPLHEMNGNWFWWGNDVTKSNTAAYQKLWQNLFDYYTNTWGLNNLLWVYSTAPSYHNSVGAFYPGSNYVDIVGMDIYSDTLAPINASDYTNLKSFGKPMAMTESGPSTVNGKWDSRMIARAIRTYYPDFSYFLEWHSWTNAKVALVDNLNATGLLNDSWIVTRDEVRISPTTLSLSSDSSFSSFDAPLPLQDEFSDDFLGDGAIPEQYLTPGDLTIPEQYLAKDELSLARSADSPEPVPEPSSKGALLIVSGIVAGFSLKRWLLGNA